MYITIDIVLDCIKETGYKMTLKKCQFMKDEVLFLGHIINKDGRRPDPRKIKAIDNYPIPKDLTDVRAFLGMCCYYRPYIPKYAKIARHLNQLMKAHMPFF